MRMTMVFASTAATTIAAIIVLSGTAQAQPLVSQEAPEVSASESRLHYAQRTAGDIFSQPIRDAGLMGVAIPDTLVRASRDPYALADGQSCEQVISEIEELDSFLGPELTSGAGRKESRVGKLAEAGGRAAVNSVIPFRTLVREVTGAAPAQRRFEEAMDLGYARRGFLRGVYRMRRCGADLGEQDRAETLKLSLAQ